MEKARLESKDGLFIFVGLVLLAALLVSFSKGVTRFARTYELRLRTTDVGGIKPGAAVLMAGFPVGNMARLTLSSNGESVVLILKIRQEYRIRTNAIFVLEQSGFLGDQYVAIYPGADLTARPFESGEEATCPPPFNLQQTARDASGFIQRLDATARKVDAAIADIRRLALNADTLRQVSNALSRLNATAGRAEATVDRVGGLVETNAPLISLSVSNLAYFSGQLSRFSMELSGLVTNNAGEIEAAVRNVESTSAQLKGVVDDLRAGKGPAGRLLYDEQMAANLAQTVANLSVTTSNLNRLGLWGILWKRRLPATNPPPAVSFPAPKNPFR
jgi:phospholipid/cholesterol/gamma-HCH transport system substrate-binding protein